MFIAAIGVLASDKLKDTGRSAGRIQQACEVAVLISERQKFAAEIKAEAQSPPSVLTDMDNAYALELVNPADPDWAGFERLVIVPTVVTRPTYQANDFWMLPILRDVSGAEMPRNSLVPHQDLRSAGSRRRIEIAHGCGSRAITRFT